MEAKKQAGRSPAACFAEWPLSNPAMRPTRSVTASPQAPDPSLRRQRQSSLPPLGFGGAPRMETSRIVGAGAIARPRADVGIGPYARKKGVAAPLRRKRRIRAGRPRKKMSFSDRLCLTQPVRDDILSVVFKDSR